MAFEDFLAGMGALVVLFWIFFLIVAALAIAVLVFTILMVVEAYRLGRSGWWIYLICLFISPLNLVALIAWHVHLKKNPWKLSDTLTM